MGYTSMKLVKQGLEDLMDIGYEYGRHGSSNRGKSYDNSKSHRSKSYEGSGDGMIGGFESLDIFEKNGLTYCVDAISGKKKRVGKHTGSDRSMEWYIELKCGPDGIMDGPYKELFFHRIRGLGEYKNGKKVGKWLTSKTYGTLVEENYNQNGELEEATSYAVQYDSVPPGKEKDLSYAVDFKEKIIQSKHYYSAGREVKTEFYGVVDKNGHPQNYLSERQYTDGNGVYIMETFYPDGTIKSYSDDKKTTSFYPSGGVKKEYFFHNETWKEYNPNGDLVAECLEDKTICYYDHGKLISRILERYGKKYDLLKNGGKELVADNKMIKQADVKTRRQVLKQVAAALKKKNRARASEIVLDFRQREGRRLKTLNLEAEPLAVPQKTKKRSFFKRLIGGRD